MGPCASGSNFPIGFGSSKMASAVLSCMMDVQDLLSVIGGDREQLIGFLSPTISLHVDPKSKKLLIFNEILACTLHQSLSLYTGLVLHHLCGTDRCLGSLDMSHNQWVECPVDLDKYNPVYHRQIQGFQHQ